MAQGFIEIVKRTFGSFRDIFRWKFAHSARLVRGYTEMSLESFRR